MNMKLLLSVFSFQPHPLPPSLPPCRFLQVRPACVEDERLLVGIVAFLNAYFKQMHTESATDPEDRDLRWILELLLKQVQIIYTLWTSREVKLHCKCPVRFGLKRIVVTQIGIPHSVVVVQMHGRYIYGSCSQRFPSKLAPIISIYYLILLMCTTVLQLALGVCMRL